MSTWHSGPFLAFDTETTGVDCDADRIVTATTVLIEPGAQPTVTSWLIDPGVPIPEAATAVHGITDGHALAHGRPPAECVDEIHGRLVDAWMGGVPVLAFNAAYDLTILDRELRRHLGTPLTIGGPVLDPFVIDKQVDRYRRGKRTLESQCAHYGVRLDGAHDATADALAAARVMWRISRRYSDVGALSLDDLHAAQQQWAAEQAQSFRAYLMSQGRTEDLPTGEWPMRTYFPITERSVA